MFTGSDTRIQDGTPAERADAYRDFFHDQLDQDADYAAALREALTARDAFALAIILERAINQAESRAEREFGTPAPTPIDVEEIAQQITEM